MSGMRKMIEHIDTDEKVALTKMGIGAAGAGATALTLNEWVAVITIGYLLLQIGLLIPKYIQMLRDCMKERKIRKSLEKQIEKDAAQ
jgi:hypothetical protein